MGSLTESFLAELIDFCRIASVSEDGQRCEEAASFLVGAMDRRGVTTRMIPTAANPVVYGEKRGASDRAILFYSHYDVVPPGARDAWESPPFEPEIREGKIWGRGTADHKGSVLARLQALDVLDARGEELPVTVKFVIEGNEEMGSPGLQEVLEGLRDELQVEGGFYSGWSRDAEGRPRVNAGGRGGCTLHLEMTNANRDLHGAFAPLVRNPLNSLIRLLGSMFDAHGQVVVPGFAEGARAPTTADAAALEQIPFNPDLLRRQLGVHQFLGETEDPVDLVARHYFAPTLTVYDVTTSGVAGRTVPASASAHLRASLVPDQDPEQVAAAVRRFIEATSDLPVQVRCLGAWRKPARAELESSAVRVAMAAAHDVYEGEPVLVPLTSGSGPRDLFMNALDLPLVADVGVSHIASNDHAANENIFVDHYLRGVDYYAAMMRRSLDHDSSLEGDPTTAPPAC